MGHPTLPGAAEMLRLYVEHQGSWKAMGVATGFKSESLRYRFRDLGLIRPDILKRCCKCGVEFADRSLAKNRVTCDAYACERARDRDRFNAGQYGRKPAVKAPRRCDWCRVQISARRLKETHAKVYFCSRECRKVAHRTTERVLRLMGPRSLFIMQELAYHTRGTKKPAKRYQPKMEAS